jgi:ribosomal protein S27E
MNYAMSLHGPMPLPRPVTGRFRPEVRCDCQDCGAHAFMNPSARGPSRCGNCGSTALCPLDGEMERFQARVERSTELARAMAGDAGSSLPALPAH